MKKINTINTSTYILQPIDDDADFNENTADTTDIQFDLEAPVEEEKLDKFWRSVEEDLDTDPLW